MQWHAFLFVGVGAGLGACLRAWLARYNETHYMAWLPFGTLLANVLGGLLIGVALILFERLPSSTLSANAKLFIITGFLGGLTTFSSFSAEVFTLLNSGKIVSAFALMSLHLFLTLFATMMGFYIAKWIF